MVIGIHRVPRGVERRRQPRIARRMLGQAVRNLYDRLRLIIFWVLSRKPAVDKQINAIWSGQRESRSVVHLRFGHHIMLSQGFGGLLRSQFWTCSILAEILLLCSLRCYCKSFFPNSSAHKGREHGYTGTCFSKS